MSTPSTPQPADRYQLEGKIAASGYGEVWRATDTLLARAVAVKLLPMEQALHPPTLARFRTEAQRSGALSHKNIARVYDYVEPDPPYPPFLVMELVDGPSAAQLLSDGPMDPARVMDIIAGAADGLQAAHEAGFVHRDIKPTNLLFTPDGLVKVTDFGIGYAVNSVPETSTNMLRGTPGYLAPERLRGTEATAAADLYGLGIIAWEFLTGTPPFTGTPIEVAVAHRDEPLPSLPAWVPAGVATLVMQLAAKDPAARPASAGEAAQRAAQLRDDLLPVSGADDLLIDTPATAGPPPDHGEMPGPGPGHAAPRPPRRPGRRAALAAAAVVLLAVIGVAIAVIARPGGASPGHQAVPPAGKPTPTVSTVQVVEVNAEGLIGQQVDAAKRELGQLGLPVRVVWQSGSQQAAGTVLAVTPGGRVAPHTLITLTAAAAGSSSGSSPAASSRPTSGVSTAPASNPATVQATSSPQASASPSPGGGTPSASPSASPTAGTGKGQGNGGGGNSQ